MIQTLTLNIFALIIVLLTLFILIFIFRIWMIIDCAKRDFKDKNQRVVWILILIFLHLIGAIIYYFAVYTNNKHHPNRRKK